MTVKVLELKGIKSLRAFNSFHTLVLGLRMLPEYMSVSDEDFGNRLESLPPEAKVKVIRQAVKHVPLEEDDVNALMLFAADPNNVPYDKTNIDNLNPVDLSECIVAVCFEMSKIKPTIISEAEKKN